MTTEIDHWNAISEAVSAARAALAAAAPDAKTAGEGEAYLMRNLAACLADAFLGHLLVEGGLTRVLPTRGGPNPDFQMWVAALDPAGSYRLQGWLNGSERVGVGLYRFNAGGAEIAAYSAVDANSVDGEGRFELALGADAEGEGALRIAPDARVMIVRILHRDPTTAHARLLLQGGPPVDDLQVAQGNSQAALAQVAQALTGNIHLFLEWTAVTSAAKNAFHEETPAMRQGVQGDPDIAYALGSFDLEEGQWLELVLPAGLTGYWSLHAYNHWCESLPGAGVGDNSARPDNDGSIRIAIGPDDTGDAPNSIDTRGRRRGALIFRHIGAAPVPIRTRLCGNLI